MSFDLLPLSAVVGQPDATAALAAIVRDGGAAPPLLLHGPEGVGKRTAALAYAAALVCRRRGAATDACGACPACRRVADADAVTTLREGSTSADSALVYPDAGYVSLPKGKSRISILQARDLVLTLGSSPYELARRVYVVDPADRMNAAAANALLKILEEPPAYGALVLVTSAPWSLPITVRSRLRPIRFRPLPREEVERLLVVRGMDPAEAAARAARAGGSLARATEDDPEAERRLVAAWVRVLEGVGAGSHRPAEIAAATSEDLASDAEAALRALDRLVAVLRDVAALQAGAPPALLEPDDAARLAPFAERLLGPEQERPG